MDDVALNFALMNELLISRGLKPLEDIGHYRRIFGFPVKDYYIRAGLDVNDLDYAEIAKLYTASFYNRARLCPLREYIRETLEALHVLGIRQHILSASQYSELPPLLQSLGIMHFFETVMGDQNAFAKGKTEIGKRWLLDMGIDPRSLLLVGDTVHDKEVADAMGIDCILLTGGHQSDEVLGATNSPIIANAAEVLKFALQSVSRND